jgi:type IX secretion system PorP/SprF family membrane protein
MAQEITYKTIRPSKWILFFSLFTFHFSLIYAQQDPQFSLYMFDKMALNPAAAGSKDALELNVVARDQWLDIQGAPQTSALLLSSPSSGKHTGWGIEIMNDNIGPTTSNSIQGNYAYNIAIGPGKLAMGLGFGVYDYTFNWSMIDYRDKNDIYAMANSGSKITPTAEAGLYYHTSSWYAGFSVNHLIESSLTNVNISNSTATFAPHEYFIAGKAFQSASGIIWNPSIILQLAQNAPPAASINLNVLLMEKIWLGASFKPGYGGVLLVSYKASKLLRIGYAYDLGLNGIGVIGGGSHELSITLDFGTSKATQVSPRFF